MTRTLLVTNDFPPKVGGIQSYLGELWRRLDPSSTAVLTASSDPGARAFDERQAEGGLRVERVAARTLYLPGPRAARAVDAAIRRHLPDLVLYDPAFPLGVLGTRLGVPYGVVLHGAELAIPARLPGLAPIVRRILRGATTAVCAGPYPEAEARRNAGELRAVIQVPPGVDVRVLHPSTPEVRASTRDALGVRSEDLLVVSVGRLVPRKGLDVLIAAVARSAHRDEVSLVVAGAGRDAGRLGRLARRHGVGVRLLGRIDEDAKVALLGAADLFAQPCRSRWAGLEQEGFGIAFLEAAACGLPQLAGRSGGAGDAVDDGRTGRVVQDPRDPAAVAEALDELCSDRSRLAAMGRASRERAVSAFDYDLLARRLGDGLEDAASRATGPGRPGPPR